MIWMATVSGGEMGMLADVCADSGLVFPPVSEAGKERLRKVLPPYAPIANPLDAWGSGDLREAYPASLGILAAEEGIAGLEVNISCPNVKNGGVLFGQDPALAAEVTQAVKKHAGNLPVIVKLSPNVTDITAIAKAAEQAGADAISCINTITGMGVDVKTRKPLLANVVGGLSGPAVKPVALRCVWQVCNAVKIPVIGIGGITCAQDVLEFILVGAHAVEIGTMNFVRPDAAFRIAEELPHLCQQLGIKNLAEFRGTLQL